MKIKVEEARNKYGNLFIETKDKEEMPILRDFVEGYKNPKMRLWLHNWCCDSDNIFKSCLIGWIKSLNSQVKELLDKFCKKHKHEHHKHRDGVVNISYDAWCNEWRVFYDGYILGEIETVNKSFEGAVCDFMNKFKEVMNVAGMVSTKEEKCPE